MAIARVQFKSGGGDASQGTTMATGNFGSSCTSGNWIAVILRNSTNAISAAPTDTLGTTYTLAVSDVTQNPCMWIYYGKLTSSGTNSVSSTWASTSYPWITGVEVSGLAASSVLDTTSAHTGAGALDQISGVFSTAQNNEYILLGASENGFNVYTAGASFTLLDGTIPTNANDFGGVEERITSSILSSSTAHITSDNTSGNYTVVLAAFKEAAAAGTVAKNIILNQAVKQAAFY